MSQEDLAQAAGMDCTYISACERAEDCAMFDVIERLANALKIEPSDLFTRQRKLRSS